MTLRRAHVLGAGISGVAAAEWLLRNGWMVVVTDHQINAQIEAVADKLRAIGAEVILGGHEGALAMPAQLCIVSPGMSPNAPAVQERRRQGSEVIGELELGWRSAKGTIAAVTGANGKSTTTALIGSIFEQTGRPTFTVGNIGIPLISVAEETKSDALIALEVSSYQLETINSFHPKIGVFLNLTPDHIERHGSFEGYGLAKSRLWQNQTSEDHLIFNADDAVVVGLVGRANSKKTPFSTLGPVTQGAWIEDNNFMFRLPGLEFSIPRSKSQLPGRHNISNVLAAGLAGLLAGVTPEQVEAGIEKFSGLPHRLEKVRELHGVAYINDSKATNCDAGKWALEATPAPVILLAGGKPKGGGFRSIRSEVEGRVKRLILFGQAAEEIKADLGDLAEVEMVKNIEEAIKAAHAAATRGDSVLLSPLCASFDQFRNFEERGDRFRCLVMNLK